MANICYIYPYNLYLHSETYNKQINKQQADQSIVVVIVEAKAAFGCKYNKYIINKQTNITQPMKTIYKKLNMAVEAINATIIEDDAFVMVWAAHKGKDLYALAKSGEFEELPSLSKVAMMTAEEVLEKSHIFAEQPITPSSVGLILHARSYRDILVQRAEQDRISIDEILTRYGKS